MPGVDDPRSTARVQCPRRPRSPRACPRSNAAAAKRRVHTSSAGPLYSPPVLNEYLTVLQEYAGYWMLAFVVAVFATPIAAGVARRLGVMDVPDRYLKPHARPTPYLGGAAICVGWAVTLLVATALRRELEWQVTAPIVLGGVAMSLLGLLDDIQDVPPKLRLSLGAAVVASVMLFTGIGLELAETFLHPFHVTVPPILAVPLSFLIGLFIVLGACNSTNLIDGLDGLCAGVTAVISLGFFIIAARLAIVEYARPMNDVRLILAIAMLGATLGFLPLNFNPAKIFMGDAGSVLLGYNCGMLLLLFSERGSFTLRWMLGGLMVFALPIFDTALAIVRRWRSGRSIFAGDRSHFYDQLVDRGWTVRRVVLISYLLTAFYGGLGCLAVALRMRYTVPLYALAVLLTVVMIVRTGMVRAEPRGVTPAASDPPARG